MITLTRTFAAVVAAAALGLAQDALAHGGEVHVEKAPPAAATAAPSSPASTARPGHSAEGSLFQVVVRAEVGGRTTLWLAESDTNAPVAGAAIEAEGQGWRGMAEPTADAGVYGLPWAPAPGTSTDLAVTVTQGERMDLLLLEGVARPAPAELPAAAPSAMGRWAAALAAAVALAGAGFLAARRRTALAVLLAVAWGGFAAPVLAQQVQMPKATQFLLGLRTEPAAPREVADVLRAVGKVVPDPGGYARVQPSQPARVVSDPAFPIPVPGQAVKRGQVIAVLEPTLTSLERGDKRAALYRIEGEIELAEREAARMQALAGVVPQKQADTARVRLEQLRREKAQLAGTALGRELLMAPVDGVVTDIHVVPGEIVTADRVLVEIVDPRRLRIEAVLHDLAVAGRITGARAASRLLPGREFPLTLLGVSPRIDAQDQGQHAQFAVADADGLRLGLPMDVYIESGGTRLGLAVPREAVVEQGGAAQVWLRTAPETFTARPVRVARLVGPWAEIAEGLKPGDKVVTQGLDQLRAAR